METIRYDAHPPLFRNNPLVFILCLALCVVGVGIIAFIYWYFVLSRSHRLTITDREVRYEEGLFSKSRTELGLQSVRSVKIYQSFFQRIFGTGDISIYSAGDQPEFEIKGMPDPHLIRELIDG